MAKIIITQFLLIINPLGLSDVPPYAHTNSITGGRIMAKPVEQRAPISEMKAFKAGTTSAKESENICGKHTTLDIKYLLIH